MFKLQFDSHPLAEPMGHLSTILPHSMATEIPCAVDDERQVALCGATGAAQHVAQELGLAGAAQSVHALSVSKRET